MNLCKRIVGAGLLAAATATPAFADDFLAASSLYAGASQSRVVCSLTNIGGTPIGVSQVIITDQFGGKATLVIDQCSALVDRQLTALRTCGVAADVPNNRAYTCRAKVSPNKTFVRGSFDIRDANQTVLSVLPLQ